MTTPSIAVYAGGLLRPQDIMKAMNVRNEGFSTIIIDMFHIGNPAVKAGHSWRHSSIARSGGRKLPAADAGPLHVLAKATHYGLYLLLLIVIILGVVNAFVRGYNLFDLASLPQIGDRALRKPITDWHGLAANLLLGLAGVHAAAALFHHYFLRDSVLGRMLPENGGSTEHGVDRIRG